MVSEMVKRKYLYIALFVGMLLTSHLSLFVFTVQESSTSTNTNIKQWTNGKLKKNSWVKYKQINFIQDEPHQGGGNFIFWIVEENSSSLIVLVSSKAYYPGGFEAVLENIFVYGLEEWMVFPFTVHIPKAKAICRHNEKVTLLNDEKRWDTRSFKYKFNQNGTKIVYEWILDEDTHIAEKIKVTSKRPNKPNRGFIMNYKKSSFFVGDEVKILVNTVGLVALVIGPAILLSFLYLLKGSQTVKQQKEYLQSEEYRERFLKEYKENEGK